METYEEVKHIICKKANTDAVIKQRENAWQTIADQLNAKSINNHTLKKMLGCFKPILGQI